jgi:hypothetical protein
LSARARAIKSKFDACVANIPKCKAALLCGQNFLG